MSETNETACPNCGGHLAAADESGEYRCTDCSVGRRAPEMARRQEDAIPLQSIGRICFVRWRARPDGPEVRAVSEAILQRRRVLGQPLLIVALFPEGATMFTASGRTEFMRYAQRVDRACECQYAVLSGAGIERKLLRASLAAVTTVMRIPAEILDDAETAVAHACARAGLAPGPVLAEASARGLLEHPETASRSSNASR